MQQKFWRTQFTSTWIILSTLPPTPNSQVRSTQWEHKPCSAVRLHPLSSTQPRLSRPMRGPNRNQRRRLTQNLTLGSIFAPVVSMSQTYLDIESMLTKVLRSDFSHFRRHRSTNSYQTWRKVSRYESAFENSKVAEQTFAASFYIRFHCHFPINSTLVSTSQNECIAPWASKIYLTSGTFPGAFTLLRAGGYGSERVQGQSFQ